MDKDTAVSCVGALLALLMIPVIVVFGAIANGYVLATLWSWFVVPTFNVVSLSIPVALGISMIVSYMTYQYQPTETKKDNASVWGTLITSIAMVIARPAFALLFGWIVHSFVK